MWFSMHARHPRSRTVAFTVLRRQTAAKRRPACCRGAISYSKDWRLKRGATGNPEVPGRTWSVGPKSVGVVLTVVAAAARLLGKSRAGIDVAIEVAPGGACLALLIGLVRAV